jgi:hypothetical protein
VLLKLTPLEGVSDALATAVANLNKIQGIEAQFYPHVTSTKKAGDEKDPQACNDSYTHCLRVHAEDAACFIRLQNSKHAKDWKVLIKSHIEDVLVFDTVTDTKQPLQATSVAVSHLELFTLPGGVCGVEVPDDLAESVAKINGLLGITARFGVHWTDIEAAAPGETAAPGKRKSLADMTGGHTHGLFVLADDVESFESYLRDNVQWLPKQYRAGSVVLTTRLSGQGGCMSRP